MTSTVPAVRLRLMSSRALNPAGRYVLYWMIGARRLQWNFALQHAVDVAVDLHKPLVVLEPLDAGYPWASDRLHQFVLDGMAANLEQASRTSVMYVPYVEPAPGAGRGLLRALAEQACLVVTDDSPAFVLPRLLARAAEQSPVPVHAVDGNGLVPLSVHGQAFTSARSYRAFVQRELRAHLPQFPEPQPLARMPRALRLAAPPAVLTSHWRSAAPLLHGRRAALLAGLPIDHTVGPVAMRGGSPAARRRLARFLEARLPRYADDHRHPDADGTSRLSPYLHFGHISAHEIFSSLMTRERWTSRRLAGRGGGRREGWWGVSESASLFLDQLVVWRELAFNGCARIEGYAEAASLPRWARETLEAHARDPRRRYSFVELESARTGDEVWNAAQRQLAREGWFHGYLRMLWGKKILEWAPNAQTALDWMEALMNRYSLDGRDPVSYASFTWVLGRYDRPWPPRPVFGTVRSMSSESTRRKLRMSAFLQRYGPGS